MEGNFISILGTLTARKKQFKLFNFVLLLTGQVRGLIQIQMYFIAAEALLLFNHSQLLITWIMWAFEGFCYM